ncbi:MAG: hypothetical protein NTW21_40410 [Verrucomicrobia bacterium]|nr:hypothetical protein [Verrucomicrobiota bacterium]
MSPLPSIVLSSGLIGVGVLAWALAGHPLIANPDLNAPLNPLGINRSPYGEVFAMAMQGPIETYFDAGMSDGSHHHADDTNCADCPQPRPVVAPAAAEPSLNARLGTLLTSLDKVVAARTNPKAASAALKRHLRRQAEDKLRFAYQLDPAHYANYNALHFFLTEPAVGTRPELTPSAAKLADDTIQYCLKQDHDPRPALTAAAAASNILHLMFTDRQREAPAFSTPQMRQCLDLLDHCLARYTRIAQQWDYSKNWDLLSPQRITECEDRFSFIAKIRAAAETTILRLEAEAEAPRPQASNEPPPSGNFPHNFPRPANPSERTQ